MVHAMPRKENGVKCPLFEDRTLPRLLPEAATVELPMRPEIFASIVQMIVLKELSRMKVAFCSAKAACFRGAKGD
jgi:hypothetical protein